MGDASTAGGPGSALHHPGKMAFLHRAGVLNPAKYPAPGAGAPGGMASRGAGPIGASPQGEPEAGDHAVAELETLRQHLPLLDALRKSPDHPGKWVLRVNGKATLFADPDVRAVVKEVADAMTTQIHRLTACCNDALKLVHGTHPHLAFQVQTANDVLKTAQKQIDGSRGLAKLQLQSAAYNIHSAIDIGKQVTAGVAEAAASGERWATATVKALQAAQLAGTGAAIVLGILSTGGIAGAVALGASQPTADVLGKVVAGEELDWSDAAEVIVSIGIAALLKTKGDAAKEAVRDGVEELLRKGVAPVLKAVIQNTPLKALLAKKLDMEMTDGAIEWAALQAAPMGRNFAGFLVSTFFGIALDKSGEIFKKAVTEAMPKLHGKPHTDTELAHAALGHVKHAVPAAIMTQATMTRAVNVYITRGP